VRNETEEEAGARLRARLTFDGVADLYAAMRPGYPAALYDDLLTDTGLSTAANSDHRLLEIGCGAGQATVSLAKRGFAIDCVELGAHLATLAVKRLAGYPRLNVFNADFENWTSPVHYELAYCATAYHWLNPATRRERIATLLAPGGWFALWRTYHVHGAQGEAFADASQAVYAHCAPALAAKFQGLPEAAAIPPTEKEEFVASGLFDEQSTRCYLWQQRYTAEDYVRMLATHSDHQLLAEDKRATLFTGLADLINEKFAGAVVKHHATILHVVRKRP
jgi:trans-aconitate methyltransferase